MFHNDGVGSGAKRQMTFQTSSLLPTSFESVSVFVMSIFTTATRKSENSCFLNYVKTSSSLKKKSFCNKCLLFICGRKQTGISFSFMAGKLPHNRLYSKTVALLGVKK